MYRFLDGYFNKNESYRVLIYGHKFHKKKRKKQCLYTCTYVEAIFFFGVPFVVGGFMLVLKVTKMLVASSTQKIGPSGLDPMQICLCARDNTAQAVFLQN